MLSRAEDVRMFESSEDVILPSSSRRRWRQQQLNGEEQTEVEEDEQLHPQHPYRMRKRVLQQESDGFRHFEEEDGQMLTPFRRQESNRPMEFVFLSSGEIRAREDCPPGLGLPKLQGAKTNGKLEYHTEEDSDERDEEDREYASQSRKNKQGAKVSRQQVRRRSVAQQHNERFASSPLSSLPPSSRSRSESSYLQMAQLEDTNGVPIHRTKRSPKMEVSHLVSDEPTPKTKGRTTSSTRREDKKNDQLESELQKEKKRVLEKMTQLLDEQGKNQQLRDRVEALEAQLAAKDSETNNKIREAAREQEEQTKSTEKEQDARINVLEEQVRFQQAKIVRLKHDKNQLKTALKQMKTTEGNLPNDQRLDTKDAEVLRGELDDWTRRLHEFLAKVERWKDNSKKEMQRSDDTADLSALLEHVWLDFPQLFGVSARLSKENSSPTSEQQQPLMPAADDQADAVLFLKKRLRQREDELRQTHVKYVELKELCARQCVREAGLQNFINEHRLRGNLIIGKHSGTKSNGATNNQEPTQDEHPDEYQPSAKLKMISSRGTNTPASYNERGEEEDNFLNDEYSDNQEDNDEYEEGEEYEYPVRPPKVFVQVGREGVYEHMSPTDSVVAQKLAVDRSRGKRNTQSKQHQVERIRLVSSPSLAQRYERVPTPTTTTRRKKSAQQQPLPQPQPSSSQPHPAMLGECPPGCGSRPSFMRRKTPTAAPRTKAVKRPISMTVSKGAVGVIRPWM
ncbi:hypothetical protein PHYPSEUDO_014860 [Phytophthora pseudosyringae]|uniref:Uncharacterized protein n=1 Tax=Phytophthora pseudosyringae TaxID=221518 RepID=A0A8T1W4J4_9STRA|nr:hypothetical protein PHYPSEUDO_014860 [Phytophthora pseudosyringae]